MRHTRAFLAVSVFFLSTTVIMSAQTRRPGLWELTTTTTWQQSPFPGGAPPSAPHTMQVCLRQEQIDKYGAIVPSQRSGCHVNNVVKTATGMTAEMSCSGPVTGKGDLEATWIDDSHAKGSVHFVGSFTAGGGAKTMEWTSHSTSVFKGSDCGSVKPLPMKD